ncbi:CCA tRNA nucleotidyltransferase [Fuchsiella alkaliacetigena]|uniref:CCA tRNA nucleotidyltransferase n=1 Tax=Fuchsiella alkaliacetigena TaxID=957042 RepID=UPI002009F06B|nr:HD domain-containing protein [Fuchsiella alkaliacetigena]MCK8825122.1 HD domain-containing protein [Fuchsiella alkaliacetigena]
MKDLYLLIKILENNNFEGYLVGGVVRDYLLSRPVEDVDLVINGPVELVAKELAEQIEGSLVVLDELRQTYRVVKEDFIYDFTPLLGGSLEQDLLRRDFTVNALALPLKREVVSSLIKEGQGWQESIIDPLAALKDLQEGELKAVSSKAFVDDPLRLFRAVRFKAELGFEIVKDTEELMKEVPAKAVKEIAVERIKEELIKILASSDAEESLNYLEEELALLSLLIPDIKQLKVRGQCKYHCEDIWTHSLYALSKLEELLDCEFWQREIVKARLPLLKWGLLFHDIGKLFTEKVIDGEVCFHNHHRVGAKHIKLILRRLAFSSKEINYICSLIRYHMRPMALYHADNLTKRGKYRFFRAAGDYVADICLLAAADMISTRELNEERPVHFPDIESSLSFLKQLVQESKEMEKKTTERLLNGEEVMELLGLTEGPQVGQALEKVREAQATGKVSTKEEAKKYLQKLDLD